MLNVIMLSVVVPVRPHPIGPSVPISLIREAKKVSRDNARVFVGGKRFQPSLTNALAYFKNSQTTDK
jgi:hypothetical protein